MTTDQGKKNKGWVRLDVTVAHKYMNQVNTKEGHLLKRRDNDDEEQTSMNSPFIN